MLTDDQKNASAAIAEWRNRPEPKPFLLEGGAGVGKTFLLSSEIRTAQQRGSVVCCAPTHKAINVLRQKLSAAGIEWTRGYDPETHSGQVITGTTAALLGIAPVISEDQDKEVKFGKSGSGLLKKMIPSTLFIDEVSMVPLSAMMDLARTARTSGMRIVIVGDAAQLPPVKQKAIPFASFENRYTLRQIVRQAEGSSIVAAAWAIRDGKNWREVTGPGLERAPKLGAAYLERIVAPGRTREEERSVFISYRNARVGAVNDAACRKLYGHGAGEFAAGELVISQSNLYRGRSLLVANQDELLVEEFDPAAKDPVLGVPVQLWRLSAPRGRIWTYYLSPEDRARADHPYNLELEHRLQRAQGLQADYSTRHQRHVDKERREAWRSYFEWRDATLISFSHPFAITSHKSQGSTYREVFADVTDLASHSQQSLYVAVTRPRENLVVPG